MSLLAGAAEPMSVEVNSITVQPSEGTEATRYSLRVRWTWPPNMGTDWTRLRVVRSISAPVSRVEEGSVVFEINPSQYYPADYGDAEFEDQQPPPDCWVYYTVFLLNPSRIWVVAGTIYEIGIDGEGWSYGLPSLMPGVAVSADQGILSSPEPDYTLVEFLQGPALFMDEVVSLGESLQHFWDPETVPPQMLDALLNTLGFDLDGSIGLARMRHVTKALLSRPAGTWDYIEEFVAAATGYGTQVYQSNNLMLNVNDSSFEAGTFAGTSWGPLTALTYAALPTLFNAYASIPPRRATYALLLSSGADLTAINAAEIRKYEDYPDPEPLMPPNVSRQYFMYLNAAATMRAGATDPIRLGIPIQRWLVARGGFYAHANTDGAQMSLMLDLYDLYGEFVRQIVLVPVTTLTDRWEWYATPFDAPIPVNRSAPVQDLLTTLGSWTTVFAGYNALAAWTTETEGYNLTWATTPNPGNPTALFAAPIAAIAQQIMSARLTVAADPGTVPWRLTMLYTTATGSSSSFSGWATPDGTEQSIGQEWVIPATATAVWVGIEVLRPPVALSTFQRVLNTYSTYTAVVAAFATYTTLKSWITGGGWDGNLPVPRIYTSVASAFPSYDALLSAFASYAELTVWAPPVSYPLGAGVHTLLTASVSVGTPDEARTYYAVPVLTTTAAASVDLIVVDDG